MARAIIGNRATAKEAEEALRALSDPSRSLSFRRFFRNPEHMVFFGVPKAGVRDTARAFGTLSLPEVGRLLGSEVHEVRSLALWILRRSYRAGSPAKKAAVADFYLEQRRFVSEWDHVDESAPYILGVHYLSRDDAVFHELARSPRMWDRRIAIVATWWFIRNGRFDTTLALAKTLLNDPEDLMHKAVGWMLREIGKKDAGCLCDFLDRHAAGMPSTMVRYATERFLDAERARYRALAKNGKRSRPDGL
jgi:3-methyladenine DNA glycosylase AlkD